MIMRVYRCTVVAGREAEFRAFAFAKSHPWLRQQPGLVAFHAARPLPGVEERTRCMVQIWDGPDALAAAFGEDWRNLREPPEEARLFLESASVEHYELADEYRRGNPET